MLGCGNLAMEGICSVETHIWERFLDNNLASGQHRDDIETLWMQQINIGQMPN